jgi:tRNA modification GTPase
MTDDTIFALSSGSVPAALAVIRISGPRAGDALVKLTGRLPMPRKARLADLRDRDGGLLDRALVLWMPGPTSATGEDVAELHCHGGRAVVAAVSAALAALPGFRPATPGEFTRRAFRNGRIDLAEAEGLADLLAAETEIQRRAAIMMAGGAFSAIVEEWRRDVLGLAAEVEAVLDFADEDDVTLAPDFAARLAGLAATLRAWLDRPHAELLKEGFRVVIAGPPNAGKSTLFNALVESEAAITSPIAGTTRDVVSRTIALAGVPLLISDTAGIREFTDDAIETIGIDRAHGELERADLVLWLGILGDMPDGAWHIAARADLADGCDRASARHVVSVLTGAGLAALRHDIVNTARSAMPRPGEAALNARQRALVAEADAGLSAARAETDPLLIAEQLRRVRVALDGLTGRAGVEDMLDALFGRFCIGK